jgi:very-short-patch-repair endonuclease
MGVARDPADVLGRLEGRATAEQILALTTKERLRAAVSDGRVQRLARGVYALPTLRPEFAVAARLRGVLSHATAATLFGFDQVRRQETIHVSILHGRGRGDRPPGVTVHQTRRLSPQDVEDGVTTPVRTVLDCATTMPFAEALAIADSALSLSYVRPEPLGEAALATRGPGRAARIKVAISADRRAHSVFESVLRAVLLEAGFTSFVPQLEIWLGRRLIRVDLGDREARIAIEADSFEFHGSREALERDCERYDALTAAGWVVLRFAYRQVMHRPEWVVETVGATYESTRQGRRRWRTA